MAERRIYFTGLFAPLLNLAVAAALVVVSLVLGEILLGVAWWFFLVLALLFLISAFDGLRWVRLEEKGFVVQAFRLRFTDWHIRVEMDYDEVDRVEIIGRRISMLTRSVVRFVALRSTDDRATWIGGWNFAFSRAALEDLAGRIRAARGAPPQILDVRAGHRGMVRSRPILVATLAIFIAGWVVLGMLAHESWWRRTVNIEGVEARARITALDSDRDGQRWDVRLKLVRGEGERALTMPGTWGRGRKVGDELTVRVHPDGGSRFTLKAERWSPGPSAFIVLFLLAFGGRFLLRQVGLPQGTKEMVEACFGPDGQAAD